MIKCEQAVMKNIALGNKKTPIRRLNKQLEQLIDESIQEEKELHIKSNERQRNENVKLRVMED